MEECIKNIFSYLFLSLLFSGVFVFIIKIFFTEKIKNFATIQDLEKITKISESVKSELSILTNKHNLIFIEEKEAIVQFLSTWDIWFATLKQNFIEDCNPSNYSELKNIKRKYQNDFDNVLTRNSKLELFLNNREILVNATFLIESTFQLQNHNIKYLNAIHFNFYRIEQNEIHLKNDDNLKKTQAEEWDKYGKLINAHSEPLVNYHNQISNNRIKFIDASRAYIRKNIVD
jgi:hypothetical protein